MHIILVCREYIGSSRGGGIGSYMQEIARAYVKMGHKVTIVTASDDTRREYQLTTDDGLNIISLSGGDFLVEKAEGRSKLKKLRCLYRFHSYRRKLRSVLKSILDADIVEVADYGAESLYLSDLDIPVVVRLHTPQSLSRATLSVVKPKWWQIYRTIPLRAEKKIFERTRYITACSQSVLDWVGAHFDISKAHATVINNPVALPTAQQMAKNESAKSPKVIFYAGTICETKGVRDLIDACKLLKAQGLDIRLKLAGKGGSFQMALQKEVEDHHWTWVEFLGLLSREKIYENYANADVCCFPSWWENMPMVCLESMARGAIVVSTNAGGTSEIITNGYNGFLTDRKNPDRLADTLEKALCLNERERQMISENAVNTIKEHFSTEVIAGKMLKYFQKVKEDFEK